MYNKKRKIRFIKQLCGDIESKKAATITSHLNAAESLERELKKELIFFSDQEIVDMYSSLKHISIMQLVAIQKTNRTYTDWCIEKGYTENNPYLSFSFPRLRKILTKDEIITELVVTIIQDDLENYCDKFLIGAPFYGIRWDNNFEELRELTKESFDTVSNTILLPDGRRISVPETMIYYGLKAFDEYIYVYPNKYMATELIGDGIIKVRHDSQYIPKNISYVINNRFARIFKPLYGEECSYRNLYRSGIVVGCKNIMSKYSITDIRQVWDIEEFQTEVAERFRITNKYNFLMTYRAYFE